MIIRLFRYDSFICTFICSLLANVFAQSKEFPVMTGILRLTLSVYVTE